MGDCAHEASGIPQPAREEKKNRPTGPWGEALVNPS